MNRVIWYLVASSDAVSKTVLIILALMSIACWAIFFYKYMTLYIKKKQTKQMLQALADITSLDGLIVQSRRLRTTFGGALIAHHLSALKHIMRSAEVGTGKGADWGALQEHMHHTVDSSLETEQSLFSILSTSAQVAPLLGLFGTVWGLVHAFVDISQARSADIVAVAPGIAEALVTTLAGLCVAIPALALFHIMRNRLYALARALTELTDACYWHFRMVAFPAHSVGKAAEMTSPGIVPVQKAAEQVRGDAP